MRGLLCQLSYSGESYLECFHTAVPQPIGIAGTAVWRQSAGSSSPRRGGKADAFHYFAPEYLDLNVGDVRVSGHFLGVCERGYPIRWSGPVLSVVPMQYSAI